MRCRFPKILWGVVFTMVFPVLGHGREDSLIRDAMQFAKAALPLRDLPPPAPVDLDQVIAEAQRFALSSIRTTPPRERAHKALRDRRRSPYPVKTVVDLLQIKQKRLLAEARSFLTEYKIVTPTGFQEEDIRNTAARILARIPKTEWETFTQEGTLNLKTLGERAKKLC